MHKILLFSIFLISFSGLAQKSTSEIIAAEDIQKIYFSGDEIFRITVSTSPSEEILISTTSDGEYYNDIALSSEVKGNTLFLKSKFPEILQSGYDKLSAHKVFAVEVEIQVPEGLEVQISSNIASVFLSGNYQAVLVQLKSGSVNLSDFGGDAVINTYDGNIDIGTAVKNSKIEAVSRHGKVDIPASASGENNMVLRSIHGDISVHKTK